MPGHEALPCAFEAVLASTLGVTLPLDDGEGKDREGDILLDEPIHRELERTGCAAHWRVPRPWRWGQVRGERVGQGAPASQTGSLCLRLLVRTGMGVDRGVVAGVSHRRHDTTPYPTMLLVGHGHDLSQSTSVHRDWRRREGAVLSLRGR